MYYQLPTGKVIYLTSEQYFTMTDEDIEYMIATGAGIHITNPFSGSTIHPKKEDAEEEDDDVDTTLDIQPDDDVNVNIKDVLDRDDLTDLTDFSDLAEEY